MNGSFVKCIQNTKVLIVLNGENVELWAKNACLGLKKLGYGAIIISPFKLLKKLGEPYEIERLREENTRLRIKIRELKQVISK